MKWIPVVLSSILMHEMNQTILFRKSNTAISLTRIPSNFCFLKSVIFGSNWFFLKSWIRMQYLCFIPSDAPNLTLRRGFFDVGGSAMTNSQRVKRNGVSRSSDCWWMMKWTTAEIIPTGPCLLLKYTHRKHIAPFVAPHRPRTCHFSPAPPLNANSVCFFENSSE